MTIIGRLVVNIIPNNPIKIVPAPIQTRIVCSANLPAIIETKKVAGTKNNCSKVKSQPVNSPSIFFCKNSCGIHAISV